MHASPIIRKQGKLAHECRPSDCLAALGAAILMFAVNRPRVDAVALLAMAALPITGVITVNEAIAGRTRIAPSQLMMPMAYAALISGMMTLVATSPNLVINYELIRHDAEGFSFFSFTPFGVPILLLSIVYMHFARALAARGCVR